MIEPEDYAIEHLRNALATDERVAEMGLDVRIAAGKVFLTGQVPTEERRRAVGVVASEVLPDYEVHNETVVTELGDQPRVEHIT
jgi:osmotically-inducible protein OsmY